MTYGAIYSHSGVEDDFMFGDGEMPMAIIGSSIYDGDDPHMLTQSDMPIINYVIVWYPLLRYLCASTSIVSLDIIRHPCLLVNDTVPLW